MFTLSETITEARLLDAVDSGVLPSVFPQIIPAEDYYHRVGGRSS